MILPPYLASTGYLWKLAWKKDLPPVLTAHRNFALICGIAGTVYAIWMIYAAGLKYLAMAFCFMAVGIIVYLKSRLEKRKNNAQGSTVEPCFTMPELVGAIIIVLLAVAALVWQGENDPEAGRLIHKWAHQINCLWHNM